MDLHGNVSKRLAAESDLITCYRMAPHEDSYESKQRAVENLLYRLENNLGKTCLQGVDTCSHFTPRRKNKYTH